jgi:hypothetical protein
MDFWTIKWIANFEINWHHNYAYNQLIHSETHKHIDEDTRLTVRYKNGQKKKQIHLQRKKRGNQRYSQKCETHTDTNKDEPKVRRSQNDNDRDTNDVFQFSPCFFSSPKTWGGFSSKVTFFSLNASIGARSSSSEIEEFSALPSFWKKDLNDLIQLQNSITFDGVTIKCRRITVL